MPELRPRDDMHVPSLDVCAFCGDSECDGIGCIAALDPDDPTDHPRIERLHDLLRQGHAWEIAYVHLFCAENGSILLPKEADDA